MKSRRLGLVAQVGLVGRVSKMALLEDCVFSYLTDPTDLTHLTYLTH